MLGASPNDDRMLLERPLPEALSLYIVQVAGIFIIALIFIGLFIVAFSIERATRAISSSNPIGPTGGSVPVILSFIAGTASALLVGAAILFRARTMRLGKDTGEQDASDAIRHLDAAINAYNEENFAGAEHQGMASLNAFQHLGVIKGIAEASMVLGTTFLQVKSLDSAYVYASGSLRHYEAINDEGGMARALSLLGDIAQIEERFAQAEEYYRDSLTHMRWSDNNWDIITTMLNRAIVLDALGRSATADELRASAWNIIQNETKRGTPRKHVPLATHHASIIRKPIKVG